MIVKGKCTECGKDAVLVECEFFVYVASHAHAVSGKPCKQSLPLGRRPNAGGSTKVAICHGCTARDALYLFDSTKNAMVPVCPDGHP
jgi:hypothetical protein